MKKISIIVPCYNEKSTVAGVVERVREASFGGLEKEIIVIDDGSTDGTAETIAKISGITVITHPKNLGKGAAVISGFKLASGDVSVIQDADLEYDPEDMEDLLAPIVAGDADVVFGSRFMGDKPRRVLNFHHYIANRGITVVSNLFTNLNLSDVEVGYKLFTREVIDAIKNSLTAKRFGIEIELAARVSKSKFRVYEVAISYRGRTYDEGKKIGWKDGVAAFWYIIKFNIINRH